MMFDDTVNWKAFKMDGVFNLSKGKRLTKADMIPGQLNYIGAISDNNGIRQFIDAVPTHNGNCITVNYNGSVGEAFYQKDDFWASDDVNVLTLKGKRMNRGIGLFLCTIIKENKIKFGYGRKWTMEKMSSTEILLPVDDMGKINWLFMQDSINSVIKRTKVVKRIKTQVQGNPPHLNVTAWNDHKLGDLFCIETGNDLIMRDLERGSISVVGHSKENNGVVVQTNEINGRCLYDCNTTLSLADRGNFFATVQASDFYIATRVKALKCNSKDVSKYNLMFIATIINNEEFKFSYGRNATDKIPSIQIKLPSLGDGCVFRRKLATRTD